MGDYKLTKRGKFVLSLFVIVSVMLIIYSGSYIIDYFSNAAKIDTAILDTTEASLSESETDGATTEEETDTTQTPQTTEAAGTIEAIKQLKNFKHLKMKVPPKLFNQLQILMAVAIKSTLHQTLRI